MIRLLQVAAYLRYVGRYRQSGFEFAITKIWRIRPTAMANCNLQDSAITDSQALKYSYLKPMVFGDMQNSHPSAQYNLSLIVEQRITDFHCILAIQELAVKIGEQRLPTENDYCPKGYVLAYDPSPTTKVCFVIYICMSHRSYKAHSPYVAA